MSTLAVLPDKFASKVVVQNDGCWRWSGATQSKGYGAFYTLGRVVLAHRHVLTLVGRPIPAGLCVDHLCMNTRCVNPDHLDVVTNAENARRRGASVTHCVAGHAYTPGNTRRNGAGHRHCATCERTRRAAA